MKKATAAQPSPAAMQKEIRELKADYRQMCRAYDEKAAECEQLRAQLQRAMRLNDELTAFNDRVMAEYTAAKVAELERLAPMKKAGESLPPVQSWNNEITKAAKHQPRTPEPNTRRAWMPRRRKP